MPFDSASSFDAFAKTLTADLYSVAHDRHIQVFCTGTKSGSYGAEVSKDAKSDRVRSDGASRNFGFEKLERLPGNIGYLDFRGFWSGEGATNTAVAAVGFLANADAVIIDLRDNVGGRASMLTFLASYLFPRGQRVHLYDIQTRGQEQSEQFWTFEHVPGPSLADRDLYVLTSHRTFSAGEGLAYFLQAQKRAVIVGEMTGGGANPVGAPLTLDEHFAVIIPNARIISPVTKGNWEGTGVKPDIEVSADLALKTAHLSALKKLAENDEPDAEIKKLMTVLGQEIQAAAK